MKNEQKDKNIVYKNVSKENSENSKKQIKKEFIKAQKDLIKQQYLSSKTNHVICLDISELAKNGEVFCAMDLAGRVIVGHCYKEEHIDAHDVIETMKSIIQDRSFLPKIDIIHSDKCARATHFKNIPYQQFVEEHGIQISRASANGHSNQVIERTFISLKNKIRKLINPEWNEKVKLKVQDPIKDNVIGPENMASLLNEAITWYNNKPHKSLHGISPNQMEDALFLAYNKVIRSSRKEENIEKGEYNGEALPVSLVLTKNDQSIEALTINQFKIRAIREYAGNWQQFALPFLQETKSNFNTIIQGQKNAEISAKNAEISANQRYQSLFEEHMRLNQTMEKVNREMEYMRNEREAREKAKEQRKNAQKGPLRESIEEEEFYEILELVKHKGFVASRKKAALLILFVTGLRVSNLLLLKVKHLKQLINEGTTQVSIIKNGPQRFPLTLSSKGKELLKENHKHFFALMEDKKDDQFFFTTQVNFEKAIHRASFDNEINNVLKNASEKLGKHLRSHSFRATLITNYLKETPIELVKEIVGHKDIKTTLQYKRGNIEPLMLKKVLERLDRAQFKSKLTGKVDLPSNKEEEEEKIGF